MAIRSPLSTSHFVTRRRLTSLLLGVGTALTLIGCGGGGGGGGSSNSGGGGNGTGDHIPSSYTITDLGTLPGGTASFADAVNDQGEVSGGSLVGSGTNIYNAFFYSHSQLTDLGTLTGGTYSEALGINDNGQSGGKPTKRMEPTMPYSGRGARSLISERSAATTALATGSAPTNRSSAPLKISPTPIMLLCIRTA